MTPHEQAKQNLQKLATNVPEDVGDEEISELLEYIEDQEDLESSFEDSEDDMFLVWCLRGCAAVCTLGFAVFAVEVLYFVGYGVGLLN